VRVSNARAMQVYERYGYRRVSSAKTITPPTTANASTRWSCL